MTDSWHRGDWMQTYTGRRFYPLDPRGRDIEAVDIAHALSLLCRYAGHVDRFYSVAEHCVLVSQSVAPEHALAALLHDATEAYVVDVPRPLKLQLPDYQAIERKVWLAVIAHFELDVDLPGEVKEADTRILLDERNALMPRSERWFVDDEYKPLGVKIEGWLPAEAERRYLARLDELTGSDLATVAQETAAEEGNRLVHGARGADYGHPIDDFSRTGRIWGAILAEWAKDPSQPVGPELVAMCQIAVKISREVNHPKRDNRVDMAGYAETLDMVRQRQAAR